MNRITTKPAMLSLAISAALAGFSWQLAAEQAETKTAETTAAVQAEKIRKTLKSFRCQAFAAVLKSLCFKNKTPPAWWI